MMVHHHRSTSDLRSLCDYGAIKMLLDEIFTDMMGSSMMALLQIFYRVY